MKYFRRYLLVCIILFIGLAFLPGVINAFKDDFGWEVFSKVYQEVKIFLPMVVKVVP